MNTLGVLFYGGRMSGITILGSAFAVANALQDNSHLLVRSKNRNILIDCGNNPVGKIERAGLYLNEITDLVLTHAHADHMGALPLLLMDMWLRKRESPLHVYGLEYTLERARMLLDVFNWQNWAGMYPVEFHQVDGQAIETLIEDEGIVLTAVMVQHLIPTLGIRADFGDLKRSIVYSCDTEPCTALDQLTLGADVLIQEAAGPGKGHTSPLQAGETAKRAGVKKLILIHYNADIAVEELVKEANTNYSGNVELAKDLMKVA
jgi:ribonuclease Z